MAIGTVGFRKCKYEFREAGLVGNGADAPGPFCMQAGATHIRPYTGKAAPFEFEHRSAGAAALSLVT